MGYFSITFNLRVCFVYAEKARGRRSKLLKLMHFLSIYYSYEPELFPGLIYRMVKPRIVLLIFVSGKVVLTGLCEPS